MKEKKKNKTTESYYIFNVGDIVIGGSIGRSLICHVRLMHTQILTSLTNITKFCKSVTDKLLVRFDRVEKTVDQLNQGFLECMNTAKACQDQTAKLINGELERHALNPAIETVVSLTDEIYRLNDLLNQHGPDDKFDALSEHIKISCQMAADKLSYLDITRINPSAGQEHDHHTQQIYSYTDSLDGDMHGRISSVITPGIIYRNKVLRPARVSVFRYNKTSEI